MALPEGIERALKNVEDLLGIQAGDLRSEIEKLVGERDDAVSDWEGICGKWNAALQREKELREARSRRDLDPDIKRWPGDPLAPQAEAKQWKAMVGSGVKVLARKAYFDLGRIPQMVKDGKEAEAHQILDAIRDQIAEGAIELAAPQTEAKPSEVVTDGGKTVDVWPSEVAKERWLKGWETGPDDAAIDHLCWAYGLDRTQTESAHDRIRKLIVAIRDSKPPSDTMTELEGLLNVNKYVAWIDQSDGSGYYKCKDGSLIVRSLNRIRSLVERLETKQSTAIRKAVIEAVDELRTSIRAKRDGWKYLTIPPDWYGALSSAIALCSHRITQLEEEDGDSDVYNPVPGMLHSRDRDVPCADGIQAQTVAPTGYEEALKDLRSLESAANPQWPEPLPDGLVTSAGERIRRRLEAGEAAQRELEQTKERMDILTKCVLNLEAGAPTQTPDLMPLNAAYVYTKGKETQ